MARTDVIVIGAGPVGLFAAFYLGLRNLTVRLIDPLPEPGGQLTALYPEKYIYDVAGYPKILAKDLVQRMVEQVEPFHPVYSLGERAEELLREERKTKKINKQPHKKQQKENRVKQNTAKKRKSNK